MGYLCKRGDFKMADHTVLVGVPDVQIREEDDKMCSWSTNKFGGRPNWMFGLAGREYPSCKLCKRKLFLVSQIYCPLGDSRYHRTLYIFGCGNHLCGNRQERLMYYFTFFEICAQFVKAGRFLPWTQPDIIWTVLRSQVLDKTNEYKSTSSNKAPVKCSSVDDWGEDAGDWENPYELDDSVVSNLEYAASKLSLDTLNGEGDAKETLVGSDCSSKPYLDQNYIVHGVPFFQPYFINVFEYESTRNSVKTSDVSFTNHEKDLLSHYQEQEGMSLCDILSLPSKSNTKKHEHIMEDYEKTMVAHGDRAFHKFKKYLQHCPQQCIRYEWNGMPLSMLSSSTPTNIMSVVPDCPYCGSQRVYELQLMPALVLLLKTKESLNEPETLAVSNTDLQTTEHIFDTEAVNGQKKYNEEILLSQGIPVIGQGIEFGTVLVFSCSKSCWNDSFGSCSLKEEVVVVQADPDAGFFSK